MAQWLAFGALLTVLIIAAATDWKSGKIYNWLTISAMLGGLGFWTLAGLVSGDGAVAGLGGAGLGLAAGLLPMAVIVAFGGMGGGDAKLIGAVGAWSADWRCVVHTAFYGFALAALFALFVMVRMRLVRQTLARLFATLTYVAARARPDMPTDSPRIPMGVALCLGGVVAALEHLGVLRLPWTM